MASSYPVRRFQHVFHRPDEDLLVRKYFMGRPFEGRNDRGEMGNGPPEASARIQVGFFSILESQNTLSRRIGLERLQGNAFCWCVEFCFSPFLWEVICHETYGSPN